MESHQAESHLKIIKSRVNALSGELEAALEQSKLADERLETLQNGLSTHHTNREERLREMEMKFEADIAEQSRQIKLAEDVLVKKKEEREALLVYLKELNLLETSTEDYKDFDWDSLRRVAENIHKPKEDLISQHNKAQVLNDLMQRGRATLNELNIRLTTVTFCKERVAKAVEEIIGHNKEWQMTRLRQEKRINKLVCDNERLDHLIKQCVATNEPMSEYLTKNIQAKCQSFLKSESPVELLNGLKKFKTRQDRIIQVLQYKDNQMGSEINKLEVAKDQTHDQLKFYQNLIEQNISNL